MSNPIVSFDEQAVKDELREPVGKTIEETVDAMLDEEADRLVGAGPYERTDERAACRAGRCERGFTTTSGQVALKMLMLVAARLKYVADSEWGSRRYLDVSLLKEQSC